MVHKLIAPDATTYETETQYRRFFLQNNASSSIISSKVYSKSTAQVDAEFEDNAVSFISNNIGGFLNCFMEITDGSIVILDNVNILNSHLLENLCTRDKISAYPHGNSWIASHNTKKPRPKSPHVSLSSVEDANPVNDFYEKYRPLVTMYAGLAFMGDKYFGVESLLKSLNNFAFDYKPLGLRNFLSTRIAPEENVDTLIPMASDVIGPTTREGQKSLKMHGFVTGMAIYYPSSAHEQELGTNHVYIISDVAPFRLAQYHLPLPSIDDASILLDRSSNPIISLRRDVMRVSVLDVF